MPNYDCVHKDSAGTFTHTHSASQACTINSVDSTCPGDKPLLTCAPAAATGSGVTVGKVVVVVVFVVVAGALLWWLSDRRLKRDIVLLRRLENGIGIYAYRYLWSDERYVGVIAQEVAEIVPDAVQRGEDGYLRVNYARLGLQLTRWEDWMSAAA